MNLGWVKLKKLVPKGVLVGFLYTDVEKVDAECVINISKKGSEPSCSCSVVNCMLGCWLLR